MGLYSVLSSFRSTSTNLHYPNQVSNSSTRIKLRVHFQRFPHLGINRSYNLSNSRLIISSKFSKNDEEKKQKRPFPLAFLLSKFRKLSFNQSADRAKIFLVKNLKAVVFSIAMSLVFCLLGLFLKYTSVPSPNIVPYSSLISDIQSGHVSKVQFEEGSRRIFFNKHSDAIPETEVQSSRQGKSSGFITDVQSGILSKVQPEIAIDAEIQSSSETKSSSFITDVQTGILSEVQPVLTADAVMQIPRERTSSSLITDIQSGFMSKFQSKISTKTDLQNSRGRKSSLPQWEFCTRKIDHDEGFLLGLMREKGVVYSSAPQSPLMAIRGILITVLSLWIPLTPLMWLLHRQLSAANSPAKKRKPAAQIVDFDDVEGVDTAKAELMEIVACLRGSINYSKLGAKLPKGVLLSGPPGTGKTLLARAVAGEAGIPFFSVSASEFVEMFVGRGAARIRDLFKVARKYSPSIIFIDELDAVGGRRGKSFNDERDQTLNQLLTEMDGFDSDTKVIVIGATNRPEALDSALCRPGRFSRKVVVGEPDFEGRSKILGVHLRGVPLEEDKDLICDLIASLTPGLVGADLANIVNEAALLTARRGGDVVTRGDIMEAVDRAKFGINERRLTPESIGKGIEKLFPWMPSLRKKEDDFLGYQTLS